MKTAQWRWTARKGWQAESGSEAVTAPDLVLYFASPGTIETEERFTELRRRFPAAILAGCSTGGEILGDEVLDGGIVATAIRFEKSRITAAEISLDDSVDSEQAGHRVAEALPPEGLRAVFVLSDGMRVNGSGLVRGLKSRLAQDVIITGGLAGDGAEFRTTRVGVNRSPQSGAIAAIGFYGPGIIIGHGSLGGWDAFGPERRITKAEGNILFELDGEPALDLYCRYLGDDEATRLPGSALLFPLLIRATPDSRTDIVRAVLGIDRDRRAVISAGDIPEGFVAQFMHGNFDHLVEGAGQAAAQALTAPRRGLAVLVSCIGRKLLLGQRIADEVEAVTAALGAGYATMGFYSYGEISPHGFTKTCELHNQTMTILTLAEMADA